MMFCSSSLDSNSICVVICFCPTPEERVLHSSSLVGQPLGLANLFPSELMEWASCHFPGRPSSLTITQFCHDQRARGSVQFTLVANQIMQPISHCTDPVDLWSMMMGTQCSACNHQLSCQVSTKSVVSRTIVYWPTVRILSCPFLGSNRSSFLAANLA